MPTAAAGQPPVINVGDCPNLASLPANSVVQLKEMFELKTVLKSNYDELAVVEASKYSFPLVLELKVGTVLAAKLVNPSSPFGTQSQLYDCKDKQIGTIEWKGGNLWSFFSGPSSLAFDLKDGAGNKVAEMAYGNNDPSVFSLDANGSKAFTVDLETKPIIEQVLTLGLFGRYDKATLLTSGSTLRRLSLGAPSSILQDARVVTLIMSVKVAGVPHGPFWQSTQMMGWWLLFSVGFCCCFCRRRSDDSRTPLRQHHDSVMNFMRAEEHRPLVKSQELEVPIEGRRSKPGSWLTCCRCSNPKPVPPSGMAPPQQMKPFGAYA